MLAQIDQTYFREVMGCYPTGVVVVTAMSPQGKPVGMTVGSFNSASLDPPLIAFMPNRHSKSWRALRESGTSFAINVLSARQEDVCRAVATRDADAKFDGFDWHLSDLGNPVIDGCAAYIDCQLEDIYNAGDHDIVIGRVLDLAHTGGTDPLLFFRGGYGSFTPQSLAAGDGDLLGHLKLIDAARPFMDDLAHDFDTEVTASCIVRHELVLAAASGKHRRESPLNQVGRRVPLGPPFGNVFIAWGSNELREYWLSKLAGLPKAARDQVSELPSSVRRNGYLITMVDRAAMNFWEGFNPDLERGRSYQLESISAPVFDESGHVAFALTIWGPDEPIGQSEIDDYVNAIVGAARAGTKAIGGLAPALDPV